MLAKTLFLKKLQAKQSASLSFNSKHQADIAAFCQGMAQLEDNIIEWLAGTGIEPESALLTLSDLLVEEGAFEVPGMTLRYENRAIKFIPLFLYGHGVTGCVEVSLYAQGKITPLRRLFMRAGPHSGWTCTQAGTLSQSERAFDEDVFFGMMEGLLT